MNTLYIVNLIVVIFAVIMTVRENKIIVKINADKADFEQSTKQSIKASK
jgi:hypothetical protein